jgi:drug/metabolite transporter (DMT)-like permease
MNTERRGLTAGLIYIILLAASTILVDKLGLHINVYILLLASTLTAWFTFNIINIKKIKRNHRVIVTQPFYWLLCSLFTLFAWGGSYLATIMASPRFSLSISFLMLGGIAGAVKKQWLKSGMCGVAIMLCIYVMPEANTLNSIIAIMTGISLFGYSKTSYLLVEKTQLSVTGLLSVRLYLLLFFSVLGIALYPNNVNFTFQPPIISETIILLILLGLSNRVLPMYFSQHCIQLLGAEKSSFVFSLLPVVVFLLQAIFEQKFSLLVFIVVLIASCALNSDKVKY